MALKFDVIDKLHKDNLQTRLNILSNTDNIEDYCEHFLPALFLEVDFVITQSVIEIICESNTLLKEQGNSIYPLLSLAYFRGRPYASRIQKLLSRDTILTNILTPTKSLIKFLNFLQKKCLFDPLKIQNLLSYDSINIISTTDLVLMIMKMCIFMNNNIFDFLVSREFLLNTKGKRYIQDPIMVNDFIMKSSKEYKEIKTLFSIKVYCHFKPMNSTIVDSKFLIESFILHGIEEGVDFDESKWLIFNNIKFILSNNKCLDDLTAFLENKCPFGKTLLIYIISEFGCDYIRKNDLIATLVRCPLKSSDDKHVIREKWNKTISPKIDNIIDYLTELQVYDELKLLKDFNWYTIEILKNNAANFNYIKIFVIDNNNSIPEFDIWHNVHILSQVQPDIVNIDLIKYCLNHSHFHEIIQYLTLVHNHNITVDDTIINAIIISSEKAVFLDHPYFIDYNLLKKGVNKTHIYDSALFTEIEYINLNISNIHIIVESISMKNLVKYLPSIDSNRVIQQIIRDESLTISCIESIDDIINESNAQSYLNILSELTSRYTTMIKTDEINISTTTQSIVPFIICKYYCGYRLLGNINECHNVLIESCLKYYPNLLYILLILFKDLMTDVLSEHITYLPINNSFIELVNKYHSKHHILSNIIYNSLLNNINDADDQILNIELLKPLFSYLLNNNNIINNTIDLTDLISKYSIIMEWKTLPIFSTLWSFIEDTIYNEEALVKHKNTTDCLYWFFYLKKNIFSNGEIENDNQIKIFLLKALMNQDDYLNSLSMDDFNFYYSIVNEYILYCTMLPNCIPSHSMVDYIRKYTEFYGITHKSNLSVKTALFNILSNTVFPQFEEKYLFTKVKLTNSSINNYITDNHVISFSHGEFNASMSFIFPTTFPVLPITDIVLFPSEIPDKRRITALLYSSFLQGILLWLHTIYKMVVGLEECSICYSIVCVETSRIPKKKCISCKQMFHEDCINTWFKKSGKVTCPLCCANFLE